MKAIPSVIFIAAMTLSMHSCANPNPSGMAGPVPVGAQAVDGRCLQELSAEWEYYPGLFLVTGDDFERQDAVARRTHVDFRDNGQRKEAWKKFAPYKGFDYGTYRLVVEFAETRSKDLLIRVPFFDMAVELFIQGESRFSNGVVGA